MWFLVGLCNICAWCVETECRNGLWRALAPACPCWCKALSATLGFSQLSAMINWVQYYLGARSTSRSALKTPQAINQLQVEVRKPKLRRHVRSPVLRFLWGIYAAEDGKIFLQNPDFLSSKWSSTRQYIRGYFGVFIFRGSFLLWKPQVLCKNNGSTLIQLSYSVYEVAAW